MRVNYLFQLTNWSRYVPAVVLEIRGGQLVLDERWRLTAMKWQGRVVLLNCEFPYFAAVAITIRPVESYEVFRPKKFVDCLSVFSEFKI